MVCTAYMLLALGQAQLFRGMTQPNPAVGAIAVKDGDIISAGTHRGPGLPHAEVVCLNSAKDISGSDLYVTLEPCCHHGRTPPCTDIIIEKGIKRVYFAYYDPNPQVAGKGQQRLIEAGVDCIHLPCDEVDTFYRHYRRFHQKQLPWVTVKLAVTSDGSVAGKHKEPMMITGQQANTFTHTKRKHFGAILTTAETLLHDDALLNVRLNGYSLSKPVFIIDRQLRLTSSLRIWGSAQKIVVFHSHSVSPSTDMRLNEKCHTVPIADEQGGLAIKDMVAHISSMGYHDVWCEFGPVMFYGFIRAGLVNQICIYVAKKLGGEGAYKLYQQYQLGDGMPGEFSITDLGDDTLFSWLRSE